MIFMVRAFIFTLIAFVAFYFFNFTLTSPVASTGSEEIVYGKYCGECVRNCARMVKITGNVACIDTTDSFFFVQKKYGFDFKGVQLDANVFQQLKDIVKIPEALRKEPEMIGKPDLYDQCGYFIQVKNGANIRKWYIDPDKNMHSAYLDELLSNINNSLKIAYKR